MSSGTESCCAVDHDVQQQTLSEKWLYTHTTRKSPAAQQNNETAATTTEKLAMKQTNRKWLCNHPEAAPSPTAAVTT